MSDAVTGSGTAIGIVDSDVGPLIAPIDPWIWPCLVETGRWEPTVGDLVREIVTPERLVINVGAHVGYFVRLARLAGARVVAYEPVPSNRRLLSLNTSDLDGVEIRSAAVSDTAGRAPFGLSPTNPGDHHLGDHADATRWIDVDVVRLDDEAWRAPHLILCDAQGEDLRILRGGRRVVDVHQPHLLIEFTPYLLDPVDYPEVDRLIEAGWAASLVEADRMPVESAGHAAAVLGATGTATMHIAPPTP